MLVDDSSIEAFVIPILDLHIISFPFTSLFVFHPKASDLQHLPEIQYFRHDSLDQFVKFEGSAADFSRRKICISLCGMLYYSIN
jgi:hypothetical protein